jgi:hypothetical protein
LALQQRRAGGGLAQRHPGYNSSHLAVPPAQHDHRLQPAPPDGEIDFGMPGFPTFTTALLYNKTPNGISGYTLQDFACRRG